MIRVVCWLAIASVLVLGGLVLATMWVELHPDATRCDDACHARRARQWEKLN